MDRCIEATLQIFKGTNHENPLKLKNLIDLSLISGDQSIEFSLQDAIWFIGFVVSKIRNMASMHLHLKSKSCMYISDSIQLYICFPLLSLYHIITVRVVVVDGANR